MNNKYEFFIYLHRYSELVGIHGKLDPLVHVDLTPEKRVKVTFTYGDLVEVSSIDQGIVLNQLPNL